MRGYFRGIKLFALRIEVKVRGKSFKFGLIKLSYISNCYIIKIIVELNILSVLFFVPVKITVHFTIKGKTQAVVSRHKRERVAC